jgi:antitoxin YefM
MTEVSADRFRQHLKREVDRTIAEHRPLRVRRRAGGDFVVLGADDWRAIEETLALNQVPGLVESLHRAAAEPLADGTPLEELDW